MERLASIRSVASSTRELSVDELTSVRGRELGVDQMTQLTRSHVSRRCNSSGGAWGSASMRLLPPTATGA